MAAIALTITDAGRNLLRDSLFGGQSSRILYFVVGTGNTAPTVSDTKLAAEVYRAIFQGVGAGVTGEVHLSGFIDLAFANVNIGEVGVIGGASATTSANTGVLIARALYQHNKNSGETITLDFDMRF